MKIKKSKTINVTLAPNCIERYILAKNKIKNKNKKLKP